MKKDISHCFIPSPRMGPSLDITRVGMFVFLLIPCFLWSNDIIQIIIQASCFFSLSVVRFIACGLTFRVGLDKETEANSFGLLYLITLPKDLAEKLKRVMFGNEVWIPINELYDSVHCGRVISICYCVGFF